MGSINYSSGHVIFESENHKVVWLGWDVDDSAGAVQTNQYLIVHNGKGVLIDPGGVHLFSRVVSVISRFINLGEVEKILFAHQDPDVSSGIALWLGITEADIYISNLWTRFMPHFGLIDFSRIKGIPDGGDTIPIGSDARIECIPAHFLHSPGNFSFYDGVSKILFSSDIGAAVFEEGNEYLFVENFDEHVKIMELFHKRYMASGKVCRKWADLVSKREISMIAPQHGAIFKGEAVDRFISWLSGLECGSDIVEDFI